MSARAGDLTAQGRAPDGSGGISWKPLLAILGGLAGGAAWVSVVGSAVMAERLSSVGVAPSSAVSLVPVEHRFVVGMRFLAIPLAAALLAFIAVYLANRRSSLPGRRGETPAGTFWILLALFVAGVGVALGTASASLIFKLILFALAVVIPLLTWLGLRLSAGLAEAGLVIFTVVAVGAGVTAYVYERSRETRLELGVVIEKSGVATGGYFFTKSGDSVYLISTVRPGRSNELPEDADQCPRERAVESIYDESDCYFPELVAIPGSDVHRLLIGPRGVPVNSRGFSATRVFAARLTNQTIGRTDAAGR